MRVVSIACSNTEIVCALGFGHLLVGVDDHSDHPHEVVTRLPRVGPDLQVDVERVAALRPDLVLASLTVPGHEHVVAALERAGLPFIAPRPTRLGDVYADIRTIAERLGAPERGEALVAEMKRELDAAPPKLEHPPRILVEWWPKPVIVPGRRSWVTDLIELVGGVNPFGDRDRESTPVSDDEVRRVDPEIVVISWCGVRSEKYRPDVVARRPGWRDVSAIRERHIACVPEAYLGRPGPRLVEGRRALAALVQSKERPSASSI